MDDEFVIGINTMCGLYAVNEIGLDDIQRISIFSTRELAQEEMDDHNEECLRAGMDPSEDEEIMTLADWLARGGELD
jgi:hypothetical protein